MKTAFIFLSLVNYVISFSGDGTFYGDGGHGA
jgi:hypothetical protein